MEVWKGDGKAGRGIVVFIPPRTMLIFPSTLVHAGGFRSRNARPEEAGGNGRANLRMQIYFFLGVKSTRHFTNVRVYQTAHASCLVDGEWREWREQLFG